MTLQLSAHARLGKDPRSIDTSTGKPMAVAPAALNLPVARSEGETTTLWLDLVAFGRTAEDLLRHRQGDLINVMGAVQIRRWTNQQGEQRENWQLIIDALISARTTRPGGGKRRPDRQRSERPNGGSPEHRAAHRHQCPDDRARELGFED